MTICTPETDHFCNLLILYHITSRRNVHESIVFPQINVANGIYPLLIGSFIEVTGAWNVPVQSKATGRFWRCPFHFLPFRLISFLNHILMIDNNRWKNANHRWQMNALFHFWLIEICATVIWPFDHKSTVFIDKKFPVRFYITIVSTVGMVLAPILSYMQSMPRLQHLL